MTHDADTIRRTYAKGHYDGMRAAGIENPSEYMNNAKMKALEDGQTSIARKVLEFVPYHEAVRAQQIIAEMKRKAIGAPDFHIVEGCLRKLEESGLIRERHKSEYVRVPAKPVVIAEKAPQPIATLPSSSPMQLKTAPKPPTPTIDPMERLAAIGVRVRELATAHSTLASEIDDVAIAVGEYVQSIEQDHSKLSQLKELLKGL